MAQGNFTHGMSGTPAHRSWIKMRERCMQPTCKIYPYYGGRGISICDRWMDFANFYADMGDRPEGTSLDRIDVNGNYEPGNCRWATDAEQARNTRVSILGPDGTPLIEACQKAGISYMTGYQRLRKGLSWLEALDHSPRLRASRWKGPDTLLRETIDAEGGHG